MEIDDLDWWYVDRFGQEFGPFDSKKMRAWYTAGFFSIGEQLLVRSQHFKKHVPVIDLWPSGTDAFADNPKEPSEKSQAADAPSATAAASSGGACGAFVPPPMGMFPPMGPYGSPMGYYPPMYMYPPAGPDGYGGYPGYGGQNDGGRRRSRSRSGQRGGKGGKGGARKRSPQRPASENFSSKDTTGMLRNIPNKYMQDMLIEEIDSEGFSNTYNYFYLPIDVENSANFGYAFINFYDPDDLDRFRRHFEGYTFKEMRSGKRATVSPAVVQGLKANVLNLMKKLQRATTSERELWPLVIMDGHRIDVRDAAEEFSGRGSSSRRSPRRPRPPSPRPEDVALDPDI